MIPHKQLKLADIFEDCKNIFEEDKPRFLSLLEEHITLSIFVIFGYLAILLYHKP